ncbi:MAG: SRPBCC family protein [Cyanobacteria bacterium J06621_8]
MNLNIIIKSILFIYCLPLAVMGNIFWQRNLIALGKDTIVEEALLQQLSPQEKIRLNQGEVILKGRSGDYQGQIIARGNLDTAWEVITDYDNFEEFLPNIASSQIISDSGESKIFEQVSVVDLWLFKEELTLQIAAEETKPQEVQFRQHQGDLQFLAGTWQLRVIDDMHVLVSHSVKVEPRSNTEKPFFYGVYESSLEETLKAIAQEITQRSASDSINGE